MVKTRRVTDLNERDESDSSSSHHSRSANHIASDGRQEERSGPSEDRLNRMERILEGMLTWHIIDVSREFLALFSSAPHAHSHSKNTPIYRK